MWITLPIKPSHKLHIMHHKLTSNISMPRGLMCAWTIETFLGKHVFIFADEKISEVVKKTLQFSWITLPYVYYLYNKR